MRFDAQKDIPTTPYEVLDANGVKIPKAIRGDTESGLVERLVFEDGKFIIENGHVKTIVERHPAPLILKEIKNVAVFDSVFKDKKKVEIKTVNLPAEPLGEDIVIDDQTKKLVQQVMDKYMCGLERYIQLQGFNNTIFAPLPSGPTDAQ